MIISNSISSANSKLFAVLLAFKAVPKYRDHALIIRQWNCRHIRTKLNNLKIFASKTEQFLDDFLYSRL